VSGGADTEAGAHAKVFGIGLSRTGAMSLNRALGLLGYRSHFVKTYTEFERTIADYDAYTHTPLAAIWRELDQRFPGSKFILTVREHESWIRSCSAMYGAQSGVSEPEHMLENRRRVYGTEHFDPGDFSRHYERHLADIQEHFKDREGALLLFDVCGGEGWEKLCPFLGRPVPGEPFPRQNTARETFARPTQVMRRFLIRHGGARKIKHALKRLVGG
jgi:hypothetical protein